MTPTSIVAYLALFAAVGFLFLFGALLLGRFLRACAPTAEKLEIYECGEPPNGSGFVQHDLRFYVVALVFIIFEVEVAFFFPWATVFGKSTQLMDRSISHEEVGAIYSEFFPQSTAIGSAVRASDAEKLIDLSAPTAEANDLALASMADIAVFFGVLLVGFAYVWKRGDLDWVRAIGNSTSIAAESGEGSASGTAT